MGIETLVTNLWLQEIYKKSTRITDKNMQSVWMIQKKWLPLYPMMSHKTAGGSVSGVLRAKRQADYLVGTALNWYNFHVLFSFCNLRTKVHHNLQIGSFWKFPIVK